MNRLPGGPRSPGSCHLCGNNVTSIGMGLHVFISFNPLMFITQIFIHLNLHHHLCPSVFLSTKWSGNASLAHDKDLGKEHV